MTQSHKNFHTDVQSDNVIGIECINARGVLFDIAVSGGILLESSFSSSCRTPRGDRVVSTLIDGDRGKDNAKISHSCSMFGFSW